MPGLVAVPVPPPLPWNPVCREQKPGPLRACAPPPLASAPPPVRRSARRLLQPEGARRPRGYVTGPAPPKPNERERAARDAPSRPLPLHRPAAGPIGAPRRLGPAPFAVTSGNRPRWQGGPTNQSPRARPPRPRSRVSAPPPLSVLPPLKTPAAEPGSVRADGGASRGSATWSALRREPSSTSSSPPTPTRWARTAGRERGGHLCGHRTRRCAPSAGRRARPAPCPPGRGWEIPRGASEGARPHPGGAGGTAQAWPGLPLSPPAAPSRCPRGAGGRAAGGQRRCQKRK